VNIKVQKEDFVKILSTTVGIANPKAPSPILSNILLQADAGKIIAVGYDLEIGIKTQCPAEVLEKGAVAIPARKIFDIIRELPGKEVEVTVTKSFAINIKAGKAYFKVVGMDPADFPKITEPEPEWTLEIEQSVLKHCLTVTAIAISHDETRYTLNGALVSLKKGFIRFVATDGKRLAMIEKEIGEEKNINFESILPAKTITELLKMLTTDGKMRIMYAKNQMVFQAGETTIISRLIEGKFPSFEQVIPKEEKTKAEVGREEFLSAIKRVSLLTSQESQSIKLDFIKDKILISSRTPNLGEAKEDIDANIEGDDVTIGFNPGYLLDVLKTLGTEKINLSLIQADKPGVIKSGEYVYVVMPMQLN